MYSRNIRSVRKDYQQSMKAQQYFDFLLFSLLTVTLDAFEEQTTRNNGGTNDLVTTVRRPAKQRISVKEMKMRRWLENIETTEIRQSATNGPRRLV